MGSAICRRRDPVSVDGPDVLAFLCPITMLRTSSCDRLRVTPPCGGTATTPRRSESFTLSTFRTPPKCPGGIKKNDELPRPPLASPSPPPSELDLLFRGLRAAFFRSDHVSADHPAAGVLAARDSVRLRDELIAAGQWKAREYTRTKLLDGDGFMVMLLCWAPECASPVHAHSCAESGIASNCFLMVLEGSLAETVYGEEAVLPDGQSVDARLGRTRIISAGAVACAGATIRTRWKDVSRPRPHSSPLPGGSAAADINDSMGIHKVANPTHARAVSLHVYAPGWKRAPLFEEMRFEEKFPEVDAGGAELEIDSWGDF